MKTSAWRQVRWILCAALAAVVVVAAVVATLLAVQPAFYTRAIAVADGGLEDEARARRLVTKVSALHAAMSRPTASDDGDVRAGRWEAAIRDDELNAWLAIDLPRSHPTWLPRGVTVPRCAFRHRHVEVAARVFFGPVSAVAAFDFEIVLRDVDQFGIVLERASLGAIPVPREAVMRALARRVEGLGLVTDLRRLDGRLVLMVHVPSAGDARSARRRIEMFSLADGEVIIAGITAAAEPSPEAAPGAAAAPP